MKPNREDGTMGFGVADNSFDVPPGYGARGQDYLEGRNAFRSGHTRLDCPYKHGHRSYQAWADGYTDAEQKAVAPAAHTDQKPSVPPATSLEARVAALEAKVRGAPVALSCFTNLDQFRDVRWPTVAVYPPTIGESIEGYGWNSNEVRARLRVVAITHCTDKNNQPYLRVELHR